MSLDDESSDGGTLRVITATTGEHVRELIGHTSIVYGGQVHGHTFVCKCADVSHACRLVSWGEDRTIRVWDLRTGECVRVLVGHTNTVHPAVYDGARIVSAGADGTLRVWRDNYCEHILRGHAHEVSCVKISDAHPNIVVSCDIRFNVHVWDMSTGQLAYAPIAGEFMSCK